MQTEKKSYIQPTICMVVAQATAIMAGSGSSQSRRTTLILKDANSQEEIKGTLDLVTDLDPNADIHLESKGYNAWASWDE